MKKILVIFLFALIFSILIYNLTFKKNNNLLIIGDYDIINNKKEIDALLKNYEIKTYLFENNNYKELINSIKNNDYIIIKNNKIFLNQLINASSIIIIYTKNNSNKYKNDLISLINKISNARVMVIKNHNDLIRLSI